MRRFFEAFPEVVMIDATHGTNASKYKLFSFMIDDTFGHGQYVQHALVENESQACMHDAIQAFKKNNPSWDRIRAIIIDKDFGEISLLKKEFPLAKVLICHFHLKKYLRTEMSKAVYGGRDAVDVDRVEDAVDMMVKSQDEKEYDRGLRYMYYLLDGFDEQGELPEPKHPLLAYFMRNWHTCKDMWAVYERGHVAHLGNHTNNRLESAWGNLKEILRPEMELDECVEMLHYLQSTAELEYASRFNVVGTRHYHGADDILMRLAALVSPHAFNLIRKEYDLFKSETCVYEGRWLQEGIVQLRSQTTKREYVVKVSDYTCSCFFMRTMLLPCHHTMVVRSNLKKKKVIPVNYIHSRWLLQSKANRPDEDESGDDVSCSSFRVLDLHLRSSKHSVLNGSTKWRTGMDIAQRVVESMSSQGTSTFLGLAKALRTFGEYAAQGVVPSIEPGALTAGKNARRESNSDDENLLSNDESTVSATLKTEEEPEDCVRSEVEEANLSEDSRDFQNADSNVSIDPAKKDSSLEDQSVTNTHPLVKSTNRLVKNDNRLVKKDNCLVKSPGSLTVRKRGSEDKATCDVTDVSSTSEDEKRMFEIISSTTSKGRPKIRKKTTTGGKASTNGGFQEPSQRLGPRNTRPWEGLNSCPEDI
ncbi:hypothetical protein PHMEG_00029363 [Phytophthora megakarya]|uniref:SWIM-type domain-containing protein n=1 Tax=Phytophthora megakarya TaxID=4795 RepID=A0A225V3S9_9STRA|nr:hypothetical protein PHMEG_00029363 [Phytophthora megakarya]